jgi:hypothetical protein
MCEDDIIDLGLQNHDHLLLLSSLKWLFIIARKQVEDLQNSLISFDDRSFAMSRPV